MVDFNLNEGEPTIDDDIDILLQQIDILFDTTPGDLFGDNEYGTEYDKYLYRLQWPEQQVREQIASDLSSLDLRGFTFSVSTYMMQGTERDIMLVQIDLYKRDRTYTKSYKIR